MTEHQENIEHASLCVSAVSLWLSILAESCEEETVAEMEMHLAAISRGLDRLEPVSRRGLN